MGVHPVLPDENNAGRVGVADGVPSAPAEEVCLYL